MLSFLRSSLALLLAAAILALGPASGSHANPVATENLAAPAVAPDRTALAEELARLGVDPAEAQRRVDALSPEEAATLQGRLDQLPAGEGAVGAVVGALLIVFIVLLVTDIAGLTDVFPFVKKPAGARR
jgi:hypothetical protein